MTPRTSPATELCVVLEGGSGSSRGRRWAPGGVIQTCVAKCGRRAAGGAGEHTPWLRGRRLAIEPCDGAVAAARTTRLGPGRCLGSDGGASRGPVASVGRARRPCNRRRRRFAPSRRPPKSAAATPAGTPTGRRDSSTVRRGGRATSPVLRTSVAPVRGPAGRYPLARLDVAVVMGDAAGIPVLRTASHSVSSACFPVQDTTRRCSGRGLRAASPRASPATELCVRLTGLAEQIVTYL